MAVTLTNLTRAGGAGTTTVDVPVDTEVLLMIVGAESSSLTGAFAPTHSGTDTWTVAADRQCLAATGQDNALGLAYIVAPTAGTFTVGTANSGGWGGSNGYIEVYAVNGVDADEPIGDVGYGSRDGSSVTAMTFADSTAATDAGKSLTTQGSGSLVVACLLNGNIGETISTPTGWTLVHDTASDFAAQQLVVVKRENLAAGSNIGATAWSMPSGANRPITAQIEFRAPGVDLITQVKLGASDPSSFRVGTTIVTRIYHGSTLVWGS